MKKSLSVPAIPTETYIYNATLGVVINNSPAAYTWQCLNSILMYISDVNIIGYEDTRLSIDGIPPNPFIERSRIEGYEYEQIVNGPDKLIKYLESSIISNIYIYCKVDFYYIKGLGPYNRSHYIHDLLLYGYNDEKKEFAIFTYTSNRRFESLLVRYSDFVSAIQGNREDSRIFVECRPVNYDFKLDLKVLYKILLEYLHVHTNADNCYDLNIKSSEEIIRQIYYSDDKQIDLRQIRMLYERSVCLKYFAEHVYKIIQNEDLRNVITDLQLIVDKYRVIFNMAMKHNMVKKHDLKMRLIERLKLQYENETSVLNKFIGQLEKQCWGEF